MRPQNAHVNVRPEMVNRFQAVGLERIGRGGGTRTRDPLLPKQVLYQAELRPDAAMQCPFARVPSRRGSFQGRRIDSIARFEAKPLRRSRF